MLLYGDVLVLHTPIIEYIFEIHLGIKCIVGGKNGKKHGTLRLKNSPAQHRCSHPVLQYLA